jgi:hypothetical protein
LRRAYVAAFQASTTGCASGTVGASRAIEIATWIDKNRRIANTARPTLVDSEQHAATPPLRHPLLKADQFLDLARSDTNDGTFGLTDLS